jgi:hypothetical protein
MKSEQTSIASQRLGERIPKQYKNRRPLLHNGSSCYGVNSTVKSRYSRQRIVESTATEECDNINCWEACEGLCKEAGRDQGMQSKSYVWGSQSKRIQKAAV